MLSPLRYPGGKAKLGGFFANLVKSNKLVDEYYVEPFAGGAGVGLYLLLHEYVDSIFINDLDPSVYSFWKAILDHTDAFCSLIDSVELSPTEWRRQKQLLNSAIPHTGDILNVGFAAFYLNRTNRSGILNGGMIGGKQQTGVWKIDARFNRAELKERVRRIARYRKRIHVFNEDALPFLKNLMPKLQKKALLYLDPPYFAKGQHLYANFYEEEDHRSIAQFMYSIKAPWVISYDDHAKIRKFYSGSRMSRYSLEYSARERRNGSEVMFFSSNLLLSASPTKFISA